jgi:aspartate aminotransferase
VPVELAARVSRVKPSPTVALTGRVARLRAEGKDIIGLGVGEPDFDTPAHIAEAGIGAIKGGFTRYTAVEGIPSSRTRSSAKFKRDNGLTYTRPQILVSTGAKQTIYNLFMALIDPGDEVVIPAPYWVSYPDMALLAEGVPVMPYAGP